MKKETMVGKKITITPDAVSKHWRKSRIGEIVDEDFGTFSRRMTYFVKIEKMKGLFTLTDYQFLEYLKKGTIFPTL